PVSTSDEIKEQLKIGLSLRPEERTWHDLTLHALNVVSAEAVNWLLPTYLFLAVETPLTSEGYEGAFFRDLFRFLKPWEADLHPETAYGRPWEWSAEDHREWIREVMARMSDEQKQIVAEVALHLSRQESAPGDAAAAL